MSNIDLYIRDKDLDVIRRIGDDPHDMLTINERGQLCYHNLQNGGGCRTGEEPQDWYEFVPNEDEYGYATDPRIIRKDMTDAEYENAIEEIVASGRGLEAIKAISQREIFYRDVSVNRARENEARLTAINKIAKSSQTASQKLHGIKPLAERSE